MHKKVLAVYVCMIFCFTGLMGRLFLVSSGDEIAGANLAGRKFSVDVDETRAYIYDRNLNPLVNEEYSYKASINPTPEIVSLILDENAVDDREEFLEKAKENLPFKTDVNTDKIYSKDIFIHKVVERYSDNQLAPHIIGHLDYDNNGIMGVEHAYDEYLKGYGGKIRDKFSVSATGNVLEDRIISESDGYDDKHGVVLTLDKSLQKIAVEACRNYIDKGAVVIMDVNSGNILASVSLPEFNPNHIEDYMDDEDNPFYNRAFAPTNVGSTFKIIVSACGLEKGIGISQKYECKGYVQVGDTVYHCQNIYGHGTLNMKEAMERSCNPYFVNLAKDTGYQNIAFKASQIGLGNSAEIMPDHFLPKGKLPSFKELENIGEATNFSFGQGMMTASPVQICQMVSAVANGGRAVTPRLVEGFSDDGKTISKHLPVEIGPQIIEERVTKILRDFMLGVVEEGSGKKAKPMEGLAGGKTGSAQTGIYDENGEEIVQAWFAGFYPYENPKYAISVLAEGGFSGGDVCGPVFKEICDNIAVVNNMDI